MNDPDSDAGFSHLVRGAIAVVLTVALPVVLFGDVTAKTDVFQVYLDALAAIVAFYFGATSSPNPPD